MASSSDATSAKVLVKASGRKSLPSAAVSVKTGRKLITVVSTAVRMAGATSDAASRTTRRRSASGAASPRRRCTFSMRITPTSTMVPMAMAMPESATMLASTPPVFMATKVMSTATGSRPATSRLPPRLRSITTITSTVMRISSRRASPRVSRVSWIRPVRS